MMPLVSPPPLSACTLIGTYSAYAQPLARTCCCHVGPGGGGGGGTAGGVAVGGRGGNVNAMITGTGPVAVAGMVSVAPISTVTAGYALLSTWPASFFTT